MATITISKTHSSSTVTADAQTAQEIMTALAVRYVHSYPDHICYSGCYHWSMRAPANPDQFITQIRIDGDDRGPEHPTRWSMQHRALDERRMITESIRQSRYRRVAS